MCIENISWFHEPSIEYISLQGYLITVRHSCVFLNLLGGLTVCWLVVGYCKQTWKIQTNVSEARLVMHVLTLVGLYSKKTGGLVVDLFHPRVNKIKQRTHDWFSCVGSLLSLRPWFSAPKNVHTRTITRKPSSSQLGLWYSCGSQSPVYFHSGNPGHAASATLCCQALFHWTVISHTITDKNCFWLGMSKVFEIYQAAFWMCWPDLCVTQTDL